MSTLLVPNLLSLNLSHALWSSLIFKRCQPVVRCHFSKNSFVLAIKLDMRRAPDMIFLSGCKWSNLPFIASENVDLIISLIFVLVGAKDGLSKISRIWRSSDLESLRFVPAALRQRRTVDARAAAESFVFFMMSYVYVVDEEEARALEELWNSMKVSSASLTKPANVSKMSPLLAPLVVLAKVAGAPGSAPGSGRTLLSA
mmetsp:Transcript_23645/g.78268  ORF Transcript_23645/g.78268 Transcript_23645/m.78268 type:complete len:200 (+) Transcript_23645:609-1208(+)